MESHKQVLSSVLGGRATPLKSNLRPCWARIARELSKTYIVLTFVPLIVIIVMEERLLLYGFAIAVGFSIFTLALTRLFYQAEVFATWPKRFDVYNLLQYAVALPVSATHPIWMGRWLQLWMTGGTCAFVWATFLTRHDFIHEYVIDTVGPHLWDHPVLRRMSRSMALWWACCMTVMTVAAAVEAAISGKVDVDTAVVVILCDFVFGIGTLVVAIVGQLAMTHHYKERYRTVKNTPSQESVVPAVGSSDSLAETLEPCQDLNPVQDRGMVSEPLEKQVVVVVADTAPEGASNGPLASAGSCRGEMDPSCCTRGPQTASLNSPQPAPGTVLS